MSTLPPPPGDASRRDDPDRQEWAPPPPAPHARQGPGWSDQPPVGRPPYSTQRPGAALSRDERNWATAAHLSALAAGLVLGGLIFVGPLVVWLVKRNDSPFVAAQAAEALNFNLSAFIYATAGGVLGAVLGIVTFGLGALPVLLVGAVAVVAWLILVIVAAVAAGNGTAYRYPLTLRLVK